MLCDHLESLASSCRFGDQEVYFGSKIPSNPPDGSMWFENPLPSSNFNTQPWIWNSSNSLWLSSPCCVNFGRVTYNSSTASTFCLEIPLPVYPDGKGRSLIKSISGLMSVPLGTRGHDASNYYGFSLKGSGESYAEPVVFSPKINSAGMMAGATRRGEEVVNTFLPSSLWSIRLYAVKSGNPYWLDIAIMFSFQFGRPSS